MLFATEQPLNIGAMTNENQQGHAASYDHIGQGLMEQGLRTWDGDGSG